MPTTDCDCYHELINMKEMFKKKCFGKSNTGVYKHLILGGLTYDKESANGYNSF